MNLKIYADMRVLYKHNNQWNVGTLENSSAHTLNEKGLFLRIIPKGETEVVHLAEINDIFLDAQPVEEFWKDYKDIFMTKEEYLAFIESEDFSKAIEQSYVSDGEYYYYPISRYNKAWIEKQPFDYVVRMN